LTSSCPDDVTERGAAEPRVEEAPQHRAAMTLETGMVLQSASDVAEGEADGVMGHVAIANPWATDDHS